MYETSVNVKTCTAARKSFTEILLTITCTEKSVYFHIFKRSVFLYAFSAHIPTKPFSVHCEGHIFSRYFDDFFHKFGKELMLFILNV